MSQEIDKVDLNNQMHVEFVREVQENVTADCNLPFELPEKSIKRIIERSANWFYKNYEEAVEERLYYIDGSEFRRKEFEESGGVITLPRCILSVYGVHKLENSSSLNFAGDPEASADRFIFGSMVRGTGSPSGSGAATGLLTYVMHQNLYSMSRQVLNHPVRYDFNLNSHEFVILGETPRQGVVLETYNKVPLPQLYNDELFFRYVSAKAMSQLSLIFGTIKFKLIGGVEVDSSHYEKRGKEEIEAIKEEIESEHGADWLFVQNN